MNTSPRPSRLRPLVTGGAIAVAALAGATLFMSSAMTRPDNAVHELPVKPLPSETETMLQALTPPVTANPFIDRLLQHEHRAGETEDSFVPLPSGQTVAPELYVESFTIEENALLNSEEPTHVEVNAFTGNIISVERRDNGSLPAHFGGSAHE